MGDERQKALTLRCETVLYLDQKNHHTNQAILKRDEICVPNMKGPDTETPGRKVVRYIGASLVKAMELELRSTDPLEGFSAETYHPKL